MKTKPETPILKLGLYVNPKRFQKNELLRQGLIVGNGDLNDFCAIWCLKLFVRLKKEVK